ncbi:MAG: toxin glutamine deamidase domain-containing protein, partial [Granulosicoccus sp.]
MVSTRSLEKKQLSEVVGERTKIEKLLAKSTVLEQLQTGSSTKFSGQEEHSGSKIGKNKKNAIELLRENRPSQHFNGVADGLGKIALETVQGVAELGVSAIKTGYDLLLGPVVSEVELAAEEVTGQDVQFPEWVPDSDRGVERLQTGAGVVAEMVLNPEMIVDAVVDPITQAWEQGRYGEAVGRGLGEVFSIVAGAQGGRKLFNEIGTPPVIAEIPIMQWSPDRVSPWSPDKTLLQEINKIQEIYKLRSLDNCVNCAIVTDAALAGHPASANIMYNGFGNMADLEKHFDSAFGKYEWIQGISETLMKAGNGARGVVAASRGLRDLGHVFNAYNDHGVIRYIDGQSGFDALGDIGYQGFSLMRTNLVDDKYLAGSAFKVLQTVAPGSELFSAVDSDDIGLLVVDEQELDSKPPFLFGTTALKPVSDATDANEPDGAVDTVLDWLFGKAEAGELESSSGTGTASVSGDSAEAIVDELDTSFERVNIELTGIALNNGWELPSAPPLDQPDGWGTDANIIGAINDMRTSAIHGFNLTPLKEAEEAQAISIYRAAVANDDETRALSLATALTLPDNRSALNSLLNNWGTVVRGERSLNSVLGVEASDEERSIGDQQIVEENLARLNRNGPRLTADEEDTIRESAERSGAADDDPETPEIAPEVVVSAAEANSDPVVIETDKATVIGTFDSDFVVESYDQGVAAINGVRETSGQPPLTADEEAIALRVYNASIADGDKPNVALGVAELLTSPDNTALLAHVIENKKNIESGGESLLSVVGFGPKQERGEGESAVVGTNIARLNNGQSVLDEQASNEMRMLHTGVTNAGEAIIEFNELGGLETDLTAEQEVDFMLIF